MAQRKQARMTFKTEEGVPTAQLVGGDLDFDLPVTCVCERKELDDLNDFRITIETKRGAGHNMGMTIVVIRAARAFIAEYEEKLKAEQATKKPLRRKVAKRLATYL